MSAARPTLLERLQAQVVKLEREADYLRKADASMQLRLRRAVEEADGLRKTVAAQAETLRDLRTQLLQRSTELDLVRSELAAEKAARPAPPPAAAPVEPGKEAPAPTRFGLMEID